MLTTNDRCQVLSCTNGRFTYCPHCSSNICMECLNEHYKLMENEYKQNLINIPKDFDFDRSNKIKQQKKRLNQLYENELIRQHDFEEFLKNKIDQNGQPIMTFFRPCEYQELKENFNQFNKQRSQSDHLICRINQLLDNFEQNIDISDMNEDQIKLINSLGEFETDLSNHDSIKQENSLLIIELDDDDSHSSIAVKGSDTDEKLIDIDDKTATTSFTQYEWHDENIHSSNKQNSKRTYTKNELQNLRFCCPLTKFKFGINDSHCHSNGILHVPCMHNRNRTYILYSHLFKYHSFNEWAAMQIVRAVVKSKDQLDQLDLFSKIPINELHAKSVFYFTSYCPLRKIGVFGLLPRHQIKLCPEQQTGKTKLCKHLTKIHKISKIYAIRLTQAVMEKKGEDTILFSPNEVIIKQK